MQLFNFTRPNNHLHCYIYFIVLILLWQGRTMKNDFLAISGQRWNPPKIFPTFFRLFSKNVDFWKSKVENDDFFESSRKKLWRKNPAADTTLKSYFHQYFTLCYFVRLIPNLCVGGWSRRINKHFCKNVNILPMSFFKIPKWVILNDSYYMTFGWVILLSHTCILFL